MRWQSEERAATPPLAGTSRRLAFASLPAIPSEGGVALTLPAALQGACRAFVALLKDGSISDAPRAVGKSDPALVVAAVICLPYGRRNIFLTCLGWKARGIAFGAGVEAGWLYKMKHRGGLRADVWGENRARGGWECKSALPPLAAGLICFPHVAGKNFLLSGGMKAFGYACCYGIRVAARRENPVFPVVQAECLPIHTRSLPMPANTLPSGIDALFSLADRMVGGLEIHGPWLKIERRAILAEALGEARGTEHAFAASRARKAEAGRRFAAADVALTAWLAKARLVVMLVLGSAWSERWLEAGFMHRQTNVPKRLAARMELGRRLAAFFVAHPEFAMVIAGVSGDEAQAICGEITSAECEVRAAKVGAAKCKRSRDAAEKRLRRTMRSVRLFVSAALGKGDPRWLEFGLNQPRPGAPARVLRALPGEGAEVIPMPEAAAECEMRIA